MKGKEIKHIFSLFRVFIKEGRRKKKKNMTVNIFSDDDDDDENIIDA